MNYGSTKPASSQVVTEPQAPHLSTGWCVMWRYVAPGLLYPAHYKHYSSGLAQQNKVTNEYLIQLNLLLIKF